MNEQRAKGISAFILVLIAAMVLVGYGASAQEQEPQAEPATVLPTLSPTATVTPENTPTSVPTATATESEWGFEVPWEVNCEDESAYNGYMNQGYCVPGLITWEASRFQNPRGFGGAMTSYAEGVMQSVCNYRGLDCEKYEGVVAVMGCGDIGDRAYIRRPGHDWEGPFLVTDCSGRSDAFVNILIKGIAVEVDYETARRWGARTIPWVEVRINDNPVAGSYEMGLAWWWKTYQLAFEWPAIDPTPPAPTPVPMLQSTPVP